MTRVLNPVIALLKTSDSSRSFAKYSKAGIPTVFSMAGWPVVTECIASAYTRKCNGSAMNSAMSCTDPGIPARIVDDGAVFANWRGEVSSKTPTLASRRRTR